jgi:hypothetical protein
VRAVVDFFDRICFAWATSAGQLVCASATGVNAVSIAALITTAKNLFIVSFLPVL